MVSQPVQDITAIIRSANERTAAACYNLLGQQLPLENIVVILERPFSTALTKSYQVGIEHGLPWTLCIDADVLVTNKAIDELLQLAQDTDETWFSIQCKVLDKFFGGAAHAGNTLYRTSMLTSALEFIPSDKKSLRPETAVLRKMAGLGHSWKSIDQVIGIHGYEQYYRDIYRTMFVRSHKHRPYADILLRHWRNHESSDDDFKAAALGLRDGLLFDGQVSLDVNAFPPQKVSVLLDTYRLEEKSTLQFTQIPRIVQQQIDEYSPSAEFADLQKRMAEIDKQLTHKEKRKEALSVISGMPYQSLITLSRLLIRVGKKIQHGLGA